MRTSFLVSLIAMLALSASAQMMGNGSSGLSNMMSRELLAPAAGRGPGAAGSFWKTDLWVKSAPGTTVTLEFHISDSATDAAAATARVVVDHGVLFLPDVMKSTFNLDQGFGNIVLRASNALSAQIRVYTSSGTGAYGASFMAMPTSMSMRGSGGMMDGDDLYQLYVLGLQPVPRFRVNVNISNAGSSAISGVADILDADGLAPNGSPVSLPFSIRAYSSHQFGNVLAGLTSRLGDGSAMQLRVRLNDGSTGMMMVIVSVVDNDTNDTYTIVGSMMDGAGGGMMP